MLNVLVLEKMDLMADIFSRESVKYWIFVSVRMSLCVIIVHAL